MHLIVHRRLLVPACLVNWLFGSMLAAASIDFAHDIAPILKERCAKCHTNGTYKGGLSFDTRAALLESGVVEVGSAKDSELIARLRTDDPDERMPLEDEPLSERDIRKLSEWIDQGLPWDEGFTFKETSFRRPLSLRRPTVPPISGGRFNPVDRFLDAYWESNEIERPALADDATFLRRVYLDTIGLLPTADEVTRYMKDEGVDRRRRLASDLLHDRRRYTEHWLTFWNDLLRNDYAGTGYIDGGRKQISEWLYRSLMANKRYDAFVRELISPSAESEGFIKGIKWRGRVNASQIPELQFAQNVSQVFLGLNMKCASCHDSFINELKLVDAYGMAAIVSDQPLEIHRCDKPTGQMATAAFLYPELGQVDPQEPRAVRLQRTAELITSPENGRFARTIVNRLWERLMGRGLVHPVDIMGNEAWNEDLLEFLAVHLVDNGYDLKQTIELIVTSEAYAAVSAPVDVFSESSNFVFLGPAPKRMTAEQFVDNIWRITGTAPEKPVINVGDRNGEPVRASIVKSDDLMRMLGRPNREQVVTTRPAQLTTLQALDLTNGPTLASILKRGAEKMLADLKGGSAEQLIDNVYQVALQRPPTPREKAALVELIGPDPTVESTSDLLWTVFMLPEFQIVR